LAEVPKPSRSTTADDEGQAPERGVRLSTSATLPAVALKAIEPDASAAGRALVPFAFPASRTR
jgi:hypothetical protein